jgi:hypothetical protein
MQLQHQFHALGAGHDDAVPRRATRKRDHRFNNSVASGNLKRRHLHHLFVFALACSAEQILERNIRRAAERPLDRLLRSQAAGWLIVVRECLNRDEYLAGGTYSFERTASSVP